MTGAWAWVEVEWGVGGFQQFSRVMFHNGRCLFAHTISLNTSRKLKIQAQFVQMQSPLSRQVMFHNGKALFAKFAKKKNRIVHMDGWSLCKLWTISLWRDTYNTNAILIVHKYTYKCNIDTNTTRIQIQHTTHTNTIQIHTQGWSDLAGTCEQFPSGDSVTWRLETGKWEVTTIQR